MLGIAAIVAGGALFKEFVSATVEMTSEVTNLQKSFGLTLEEADDLADHLQLLGIRTDDYIRWRWSRPPASYRQREPGEDGYDREGYGPRSEGRDGQGHRKLAEYKEGIDRNIAATVLFGRGGGEALNLVRLTMAAWPKGERARRSLVSRSPRRIGQRAPVQAHGQRTRHGVRWH